MNRKDNNKKKSTGTPTNRKVQSNELNVLARLLLYPIGLWFFWKDKAYPSILLFWRKKMIPLLLRIESSILNAVVYIIAVLWVLTPIYWKIGKPGTLKLLEQIEYKFESRKLKFSLTGATLGIAAVILIVALVPKNPISTPQLPPKATAISEVETTSQVVSLQETKDTAEAEELVVITEPTIPYSDDDIELLILTVQNEMGCNDELFENIKFVNSNNVETLEMDSLEDVSYDIVQQVIAKIIVNQMETFGYSSIREVLADEQQWGETLSDLAILQELYHEGKSFENADVAYTGRFNLNDKRTIKNVFTVLRGEDNLPDNLLYERCTDVYETSDNLQDAWSDFCAYYDEDRISCYMYADLITGGWWLCATDTFYPAESN
ncbi:MAG: hypothetical protein IKF38_05645 [Clostridia bacterium]|nr:hypothetical protein [Clostridia bacterium]